MRLLKGPYSKGRVHRAYTANKIVFEAEGEEWVGEEARVDVPPGTGSVRFGDIWEDGTGFMIRTKTGGAGWLSDYPTRIPMHLLKDSYSRSRVYRAFKTNKIFFEAGGEAPRNEEEVWYGSQRSTEGMEATEGEETEGEEEDTGAETGGSQRLARQLCFEDDMEGVPKEGEGGASREGGESGREVRPARRREGHEVASEPLEETSRGRVVRPTRKLLESREGAGARKVPAARGHKRVRDSPAVTRKKTTGPEGGPSVRRGNSDQNRAGMEAGGTRVRVPEKRVRGALETARKRARGPERGCPGESRGEKSPQEAEESMESTLSADTESVHLEAPERGPSTQRSPERGTVPALRGRDATAHRQPPAARPPKDPG